MQEVVFAQAIHDGMNCKDYQDDLRIRAENDAAALQTRQLLTVSGQKGEHLQGCLECDRFCQSGRENATNLLNSQN